MFVPMPLPMYAGFSTLTEQPIWTVEQLSVWRILLFDEAQFNWVKTEFSTQSYRPQIILTISIPVSSNNVFRWLCGVVLAVII
jgi:hypothetical protein